MIRNRNLPDSAPPTMLASSRDALRLAREPCYVRADGRVVAVEPKDALLLAYLALEGPTPRRVLASLLWPDVDGDRARANLRQRLYRLRRSVGRDLLEGGDVAALCGDLDVDLNAGDAGHSDGLLLGLDEADAGGLAEWLPSSRASNAATAMPRARRTLVDARGRRAAGPGLACGPAAGRRRSDLRARPPPPDAAALPERRPGRRARRLRRCCDALQRSLGVAPDAETEVLRAQVEADAPVHGRSSGVRCRSASCDRRASSAARRSGTPWRRLGKRGPRASWLARPDSARPASSAISPRPARMRCWWTHGRATSASRTRCCRASCARCSSASSHRLRRG